MRFYSVCLSLTFFTERDALEVHLCCHNGKISLFYGQIIFYYIEIYLDISISLSQNVCLCV